MAKPAATPTPISKTLSSFYSSQIISNDLFPGFTLTTNPIDLQKFANEDAKTITIKSIKLSFNNSDSVKFNCGRSKTKNSKIKNLSEWIKEDEIAKLIEKSELKAGIYEIFFKKSEKGDDVQEKFTVQDKDDLEQLAELGVTNAQLVLGLLYAKCIESKFEQDDERAIELFQKVSEQDSVEGNLCLGYMYSREMSPTYDSKKAFAYYTKAEAQGSGLAARNLAIMHLVGEYVTQNLKESVKLFKKANNQYGDNVSGNILGLLHQKGIGVPKGLHEAIKYFRKSSDLNDYNAKINLGLLLFKGEGIEKNEVEGVQLFKEAAENGFVRAQILLAKAYENGLGIGQDYEKAFEWFTKVAEYDGTANSSIDYVGESQFCLATLYEKGNGVEKNPEKALHWYTKSAENNYLMAQVTLGDIYRNGRDVEVDEGKALKWYITAARFNHYQAQFALGELYENGILGVKQDENKALDWYKKSAEQGYIMALVRLGIANEITVDGRFDVSSRLRKITKLPPPVQNTQPQMVADDEEIVKEAEKYE